jgi:hypothetical protein
MLSDSELQELADDIKANGLQQNIMVHEGKILDGRNRHAACQIAGVPIENFITQYEGSDPVGYVISANLKRRHLGVGARAMIAEKLATATVGGDHSTNSTNGVTLARIAKQTNVGTTSATTARAISKTAPEVAADVKAGKISLNEGAKRAGVAKKAKAAKRVFQLERADSSEEPDTKAKRASTSGAEAKEVPVVDDATSKEEKFEKSFWNWVESHDPDNFLAIKAALQQTFAQMDLGDLAIAAALKQIVGLMDLQDLKEIVAIKELEEDAALADVGAPSASAPEMEATSSKSQQADNVIESPAVGVDTPVTTPKTPRKKPSLTKEEQCDQPVENDEPVEPDQSASIPTIEMKIPTARETASVQPVTSPTVETKTVRELTREKLERALEKSGNPRDHNLGDILNALEEKGWDIRNRQEQTLANTLAKCETVEALMKVFANNAKKVIR